MSLNQYRTLECFGIAGLVTPLEDIYYSALFDTKHLGRIGDLLIHFLRIGGMAEYRLRRLIDQATYQGYFDPENVGERFRDPLTLECAKDHEKVVVGLSFLLHGTSLVSVEELKKRFQNQEATNSFEEMILALNEVADEMVLKLHPSTHRVELDLMIIHESPSSFSFFKSRAKHPSLTKLGINPPTVVVIDEIKNLNPPEPKSYIDIGDLKYPKFLEREIYDMSTASQTAREFPVRKNTQKKTLFEKIFRLEPSIDRLVENLKAPIEPALGTENLLPDLNKTELPLSFEGLIQAQHSVDSSFYSESKVNSLLRDVLTKRIEIKEFAETLLRAFRSKEAALQNHINSARSENHEKDGRIRRLDSQVAVLQSQVRELAAERTALQSAFNAIRMPPPVTPSEKYEKLKYKFDRLLEQAEEFKKLNRRLIERFDLLNNPNTAPDTNPAEAKRRLEAAMMQLSKSRADNIELKEKVAQLSKSEASLKDELAQIKSKA